MKGFGSKGFGPAASYKSSIHTPPVPLLPLTSFDNKFVTRRINLPRRKPVRSRKVRDGQRWFGNCPVGKGKSTVYDGLSVGKFKRISYVKHPVGKWTIGSLPCFICVGCLTGEGYLGRGYFGDRHLVYARSKICRGMKLRVSPEEILLLPVGIQDFCLQQIFACGTFTNPFIIEAGSGCCNLGYICVSYYFW